MLEASRRVCRTAAGKESAPSAAQQACIELGVYDENGNPVVDEEPARAFRELVLRLLLRSDKETAVRLTAAVLLFVEGPLPSIDLTRYPRADGRWCNACQHTYPVTG